MNEPRKAHPKALEDQFVSTEEAKERTTTVTEESNRMCVHTQVNLTHGKQGKAKKKEGGGERGRQAQTHPVEAVL